MSPTSFQPSAAAGKPPEDTSHRRAGVVSIAVMMSRILGLVREIVLGALFGASKHMDAFMIAFRTPNMLRDLFAEGALSTAFVTTFSQKGVKEGDESAWELGRKMLTLTALAMSIIAGFGILLAPFVMRLFALGWTLDNPELIPFTVRLSQIIFAFIIFLSLAALVMGMLNSKGVFFVPALASSFFNLGSIISGVAFGYWLDPEFGPRALYGIAAGVVVGGFCQLVVQWPSLRGVGFHFKPDFRWNDPGVKRVLTLMGPAVISGAAVQVGVALNTMFATFLAEGSVTYLQWAFRLIQLPIGVFGVAIATVTLPAVSRAATEGISDDFRRILSRGLRLVMVLTIPSAIGLAILAEPIIAVIFQRGRFDTSATLGTALALRYYAVGLVFYSALKIIQPTFYAIDKKWVPMGVSLGVIALTAGLNCLWIFVLDKGHEFLALSITISSMVNFTVLYVLMRHFAGHLYSGKLGFTLLKLAVASFGLAAVAILGRSTVLADWETQGFILNAGGLFLTIAVAAAVYFITTKILNVEEAGDFLAMIQRRAGKPSA